MKVGVAIAIGPIHRVLVAARLETCGEGGQAGNELAPVNPKRVAIAVGGEVGQPGNRKLSLAVIRLGVADRSRKMAAAEDGTREIDTAAVGDGLEVGVCPRLPVIGGEIEGDKIGVVVVPGGCGTAPYTQTV